MPKFLASLRLFFVLCALLAAVFVWQTLFNKGVPVYGTPWFAALGLLLAINIAACSLRRGLKAPAGHLLLHAGLVVVIAGAFVSRAQRFEAQLPLYTGRPADIAYHGGDSFRLPFTVSLEEFRIDYYREPRGRLVLDEGGHRRVFAAKEGLVVRPASGGTVKVLRTVRDFGITPKNEVVEKSRYWLNPAVQLLVSAGGHERRLWIFSHFPGMHRGGLPFEVYYPLEQAEIRGFHSLVSLRSADGAARQGEVAVNRPLKFGDYSLYQTSYDPADAGYSLLTVTRDRGVWVVYAGFILVLLGVLLWLRR